ncbi:MAG TPA: ribonuclease Z [Beijerinckiaceae bacterium]|nr:ribonuclease Z [Beijerinckiaceae bacterium]
MSWLVQPRLINGPFDDPGVYLDFRHGRRALLFDLPDLAPLSSRELLRVTHAFVSHTHMDHFAGFDRLLRLCLHRPEPLHLVGPEGFIGHVEHRLQSYVWNLLDEDSPDFRLTAAEFVEDRITAAAQFRAREAFRRREAAVPDLPPGCVLHEEAFRVDACVLDHGIPCLAFALRERLRVNVWRGSLERLGLPVGPWLNTAKQLIRAGAPDETLLEVEGNTSITLGELRREALHIGSGQVVAYVTDAAGTPENEAKVLALARDADQLFIEAVFLEEDAQIAARRLHLTAAHAGRIAREAGARHLASFHYSPRYLDRPDAPRAEVEQAFAGEQGPRLSEEPTAT